MFYCVQPIPNCYDSQVLNDSYIALNKTVADCWVDRQKFISGRVYLAAAIFNAVFIIITTVLFIYCASGSTSTEPALKFNTKSLKQSWRRHSLQKRSIAGTVFGAIGHFIFSTNILLAQAMNGYVGCELLLWGIMIGFYTWMFAFCTRAYRLRFLYRLNELKVKYLRMSTSERLLCLDDKDYRWYLVNRRNIGNKLMKPYILYILTIIIMVVIAVPLEVLLVRTESECEVRRAAGLLVAYFGTFIVFLVPFMLWYLKDSADAHGIRAELWIDAIVGIFFFILYIVWFCVLSPTVLIVQHYQHKVFIPANWVVFFTAAAHIVTVVFPVIAYLPIQNKYWVKFRDCVGRRCSLQKRPSANSSSNNAGAVSPSSDKSESEHVIIDPSTSASVATMEEILPELSIDSLERSMADPEMMYQLQDLAIRDFSSENLLFYETYLNLEAKFKKEIITPPPVSHSGNISRNWINTYFMKKSSSSAAVSTTASIVADSISKTATSADIEQQNLQKFLSTPIPYKLHPDFVRFYETFIREDTPSQVNISYRARHAIDEAFAKVYQKYPDLNPRIDEGNGGSICPTVTIHEEDDDDRIYKEKVEVHHQEETIPVLTLGVFEIARIEVCWNIFNSVFPKFVDMYNSR